MPEPQTSNTSKYAPKFIPIANIIDLIEHKGLSQKDAAKILGCDHSNISRRLSEIDYSRGNLVKYKEHRADVLAFVQAEILKNITPDKLKKSSAAQLASMYGIFFDKERLERGQSTENIAYADMLAGVKSLQNKRKELEQELGIEPQDETIEAQVIEAGSGQTPQNDGFED